MSVGATFLNVTPSSSPTGPRRPWAFRLVNVTGVTVQNGTVSGFDAGVAIEGGSGNTIRAVTARDNMRQQPLGREPVRHREPGLSGRQRGHGNGSSPADTLSDSRS